MLVYYFILTKTMLSIIIPAYNEENRIVNTLDSYYNFFNKKYQKNFEILVVVNGSTDKTIQIVKKYSKNKKQIRYFNEGKIYKGGAIIKGFKEAKGELIGFVDADNSTKPEAFYDLIQQIDNYDGIIGSRWMKESVVKPKQPLTRRIASRVFNILIRTLFRINVRDSQCGNKLFKKEAVKKIENEIGIARWAFDINLLYLLKINNFKVKEVTTVWSDAEGSKLNVKKASIEMFLAIIRLRLLYSPFKFIVRLYDNTMMFLRKSFTL